MLRVKYLGDNLVLISGEKEISRKLSKDTKSGLRACLNLLFPGHIMKHLETRSFRLGVEGFPYLCG